MVSEDLCVSVSRDCLRRMCAWRLPPNWSYRDWAEELASLARIAAWQAAQEFDPVRGVPAEAFIRLRVLARGFTRYRQEWGYAVRCVSDTGAQETVYSRVPSKAIRENEEIQAALMTLPERDRWLIEQHCLHGRTTDELGRELGISHQAISKRKRAIITALRACLEEEAN